MRKKGFYDPEIASFNSLRFVSALVFALPLGIFIRGKKLKPFLSFLFLMVPFTSVLIIQSIYYDINYLIRFLVNVGIKYDDNENMLITFYYSKYKLQNTSESLSLIASTWSLSTIFSGLIISGINWIDYIVVFNVNYQMDERIILLFITFLGMGGFIFSQIDLMKALLRLQRKIKLLILHKNMIGILISKAISPLILISIGLG